MWLDFNQRVIWTEEQKTSQDGGLFTRTHPDGLAQEDKENGYETQVEYKAVIVCGQGSGSAKRRTLTGDVVDSPSKYGPPTLFSPSSRGAVAAVTAGR